MTFVGKDLLHWATPEKTVPRKSCEDYKGKLQIKPGNIQKWWYSSAQPDSCEETCSEISLMWQGYSQPPVHASSFFCSFILDISALQDLTQTHVFITRMTEEYELSILVVTWDLFAYSAIDKGLKKIQRVLSFGSENVKFFSGQSMVYGGFCPRDHLL